MSMKKALIAMSGGVDSSVAAFLTQQAGFDCMGAMMRLYDNEILPLLIPTPAARWTIRKMPAAWPSGWECPFMCSIPNRNLKKRSSRSSFPAMNAALHRIPALSATGV